MGASPYRLCHQPRQSDDPLPTNKCGGRSIPFPHISNWNVESPSGMNQRTASSMIAEIRGTPAAPFLRRCRASAHPVKTDWAITYPPTR